MDSTVPAFFYRREVAGLLRVTERTVASYDYWLQPTTRGQRTKVYFADEVHAFQFGRWLELARLQFASI